jgi:hypothetical protein
MALTVGFVIDEDPNSEAVTGFVVTIREVRPLLRLAQEGDL